MDVIKYENTRKQPIIPNPTPPPVSPENQPCTPLCNGSACIRPKGLVQVLITAPSRNQDYTQSLPDNPELFSAQGNQCFS